jgi:hypothetical protein
MAKVTINTSLNHSRRNKNYEFTYPKYYYEHGIAKTKDGRRYRKYTRAYPYPYYSDQLLRDHLLLEQTLVTLESASEFKERSDAFGIIIIILNFTAKRVSTKTKKSLPLPLFFTMEGKEKEIYIGGSMLDVTLDKLQVGEDIKKRLIDAMRTGVYFNKYAGLAKDETYYSKFELLPKELATAKERVIINPYWFFPQYN